MVVGDRETDQIEHFSPLKKRLQRLGSAVVRARLGHHRPRHHVGLPRLQPRGRAPDAGGLEVHLHARDDHPGRARCSWPSTTCRSGPTRRRASRGCSRRCGPTCGATPGSIFRIYSLYEPMRVFFIAAAVGGAARRGHLGPLPLLLLLGRGRGPRPVAHPRLDAARSSPSSSLALGVIGDILAGSRVLQQRILERVRRVELHAGRRALALRAGGGGAEQPRTTGAASGRPPARARSASRRGGR